MKFTAKTMHCGAPLSDPIYLGTNKDGRHRIMCNNEKMLANADLYEIVPKEKPDGQVRAIRRLVSTTPGHEKGAEGEVSFIAQCPESKKRYRLIGSLTSCSAKPALSESSAQAALAVQHGDMGSNQKSHQGCYQTLPVHAVCDRQDRSKQFTAIPGSICKAEYQSSAEVLPAPTPTAQACAALARGLAKTQDAAVHKSVTARQAKFQQELVRIERTRATGLDPHVDVEFIIAYFPTSRATAYRKIKLGTFPAPIKRGSRSVWPFSVIEAYRLGQWVSSADAGASGT